MQLNYSDHAYIIEYGGNRLDIHRGFNVAGEKREFTIQRENRLERTVVGVDGQKHVMDATKQDKDGHYTDEGRYRRTIEAAVAENSR